MNLVLVSTPLQALVARGVLEREDLRDYDVVYSAYADLPAHRHYFERLAASARRSTYLADVRAGSALMRHVLRRRRLIPFLRAHYDTVLLASIDSVLFRRVAARHSEARLVTFDDGAANVLSISRMRGQATGIARVAETVLSIPSTPAFRARIAAHYTLFPGEPNIVEDGRLRPLRLWGHDGVTVQASKATFFLGQPYEEAVTTGGLDQDAVSRLRAWLQTHPVDYYLAHPRETRPLVVDPVTSPSMVAEEHVFALAGDRRPEVFGWFTTALLNLPPDAADKWYISLGSGPAEEERIAVMRRAGCGVLHA
jgi:N-acetyllactosaminide alpha-2,3-sialyltransferase